MQGKQLAPASGRSFEASCPRGAQFVVAKRREGAIMSPCTSSNHRSRVLGYPTNCPLVVMHNPRNETSVWRIPGFPFDVGRGGGAPAVIPAIPTHVAFSPRAMRTWGGSTKRARSSPGCAPLPLRSCRAPSSSATPRTASCSCRAYDLLPAARHEHHPSSCRHPSPAMSWVIRGCSVRMRNPQRTANDPITEGNVSRKPKRASCVSAYTRARTWCRIDNEQRQTALRV